MFRFLRIVGFLCCLGVSASHVFALHWEVLGKTGDIAPETLGEDHFYYFERPVIGENGDVVVATSLNGPFTGPSNDRAYIRFQPSGEASMIARENMPLEIGRDSRLNESRIQGLAADGQIMLTGQISGNASGYVRAWTFTDGSFTELMRSMTPSGRGDGSRWRDFEGRVADNGLIVGRLQLYAEDENQNLDTGIWWSPDGMSTGVMLVREGDSLPGLDPTIQLGEVGHVAVNRFGQFAVATDLQFPDDPDPWFSTTANLLAYTPGVGWSEIATKFTPVPDAPGATFTEYSFPTFNDKGYVGFTAFADEISAWVVDPEGQFRRVLTENDPGPAEGEVFRLEAPGNEATVQVDGFGRAALEAELFGGQSSLGPHVVVQSRPGDEVQIVARSGQTISDRPNLRFGDPNIHSDIFDVTLSDSGFGVIGALVSPSPAEGIGSGLFSFDIDGNITTLIAPGDPIEVTPGDIRVVQTAWMTHDDHSTALTGLANDGTLTVWANFTDQTQAILRTRLIPEPTTSASLPSAVLFLLLVNRRARHDS